ncbi:hypothetical protein WJX81_007902, partial [Elliptochloris bilobata]
ECTFREVLEDDGNRQLVEVEQTAMCLFKTVRTRTFVYQDRSARTVEYRLARQGAMRCFEGLWTITPCKGGCTAALEQRMQPAFVPPPPFKRFLRRALLGKAAHMLRDMQGEAEALRSKAEPAAPRPLVKEPSLPTPGAPTATLRLGSLSLGCHKIDWAAEEEAEEAAA